MGSFTLMIMFKFIGEMEKNEVWSEELQKKNHFSIY